MSKRFKICLSLWFAVLAISLCCGQSFAQELQAPPAPAADPISSAPSTQELLPEPDLTPVPQTADEDWVMEITPALKVRTEQPAAVQHVVQETADGQTPLCPQHMAAEYQRIYDSIPFNRAEYNRNPTYRHDSAMEILTGNARHQTIVKHQPQQAPQPVVRRPSFNPYQFGYLRPALRLNYYRYFPSLNPYLNAYNLSGAF